MAYTKKKMLEFLAQQGWWERDRKGGETGKGPSSWTFVNGRGFKLDNRKVAGKGYILPILWSEIPRFELPKRRE